MLFNLISEIKIIQHIHRIFSAINEFFLDRTKTFYKVWHLSLHYKINKYLPHPLSNILKPYLQNRKFYIYYKYKISQLSLECLKVACWVSLRSHYLCLIFQYFLAQKPNYLLIISVHWQNTPNQKLLQISDSIILAE